MKIKKKPIGKEDGMNLFIGWTHACINMNQEVNAGGWSINLNM